MARCAESSARMRKNGGAPSMADSQAQRQDSLDASTLTGQATDHLRPLLPRYLDDLAAFVNTDSGTYDRADVNRFGALVRERIAAWDADIVLHAGDPFGDSFAATISGAGGPRVALLVHLDTVFPGGTAAERPFRIEGDRAYGPGVCDM